MKNVILLFAYAFILLGCNKVIHNTVETDVKKTGNNLGANLLKMDAHTGYLDFYWDDTKGKLLLAIEHFDEELLYVNSLAAGVGSNDIGLDRGQLGNEHVVKFVKVGPKVLLTQVNYDYRAVSENEAERNSVEEAFAQSVLWGFKVEGTSGGKVLVDATSFLLRDAHGVIGKLKRTKQGAYKLDASRSAIYLPRCKAFPENTELEATLTFTGEPKGGYIRSVAPNPEAVTVRQHHSFIKLPDADYKPRIFDPRSGYFGISYQDYATPIDQPLVKRYITRHRLEKKSPDAAQSEAVEPIVYYLDPGAPEPVRSALLDGARWWNQAFEAAGYVDAFQVEILPEDADPMDVRYNLIQWVHRATRGWSYGASVIDPRTGEIIKGHVSLGSLRVRQDFLIAQGLLAPYEKGKPVSNKMEEMALARLRQLSAHEIGHTIGLAHNFAASYNDRASVMDYPHPLVALAASGNLDFSKAYDDKIGEWDKRTVLYGYQDFPSGTDEEAALLEILNENNRLGLKYISDADARPIGGAHPYAHLWDNGTSAIDEFERMSEVRKKALENFGENNIPENAPMATLEEVLVPIYLSHRFQMEAVSKLIGGVDYAYTVRSDGQEEPSVVADDVQKAALNTLVNSISPSFLMLPGNVLEVIPPKPLGYGRTRESFKSKTGVSFDPIAAAESAVQATLQALLHPHRANRIVHHHAIGESSIGLGAVLEALLSTSFKAEGSSYEASLSRMRDELCLNQIMSLAMHPDASVETKAHCQYALEEVVNRLKKSSISSDEGKANRLLTQRIIAHFQDDPSEWKGRPVLAMPAGSPIGCGHEVH